MTVPSAGRSLRLVSWSSRVREDLGKPEVPTGPSERGFLVASAVAIVGIAQLSDPGSVLLLSGLSPAVAAFVLRGYWRRMPAELFAALVVVPVSLVVAENGDLEGAYFLTNVMMLYTAWHLGSVVRAAFILAVAAAAPWLVAVVLAPEAGIAWTPWASAQVLTFALGRLVRRQQDLIDQLERARGALAEQAVAEERRRIARELHDLAGHTLAAMLLHVTGARHVLGRDVDEAERALLEAEAVGRSSLDQIRATVSALRTHERGTDPSAGAAADLPALVAEYRRAGLDIDASISEPAVRLEGPVGTAVHRIAREALANVARHAPSNAVEMSVAVDGGAAHLVVVDRGRPGAWPDPDAGHFGLVGMQERARALGGELGAHPTEDGWRVEAWLPTGPAPELRTALGARRWPNGDGLRARAHGDA